MYFEKAKISDSKGSKEIGLFSVFVKDIFEQAITNLSTKP
jgi:hypothetical protein